MKTHIKTHKDPQCQMKTIARIRTDFPTKFGIPRQSGLVNALKAVIVFEPEYRNPDALCGLEEFSHIWLIWGFSKAPCDTDTLREAPHETDASRIDNPSDTSHDANTLRDIDTSRIDTWSPTVRPPRLGGNTRKGVFATRSPFRPNALGLSSVKLDRIELHPDLGPILRVLGADLMDNSPIYDIKPYLPFTDSHPDAVGGFADPLKDYALEVEFPEQWLRLIPQELREALLGVLAQDPRPSYQNDPERIYGLEFGGVDIRFTVRGIVLCVCEVVPLD